LAGIDEPHYGALKKASIFSGDRSTAAFVQRNPDRKHPTRTGWSSKLGFEPGRSPKERGSVHKGLLVMHCIFTTTNGVKLYVSHSFIRIYGIIPKKQVLYTSFGVLNNLTKWTGTIIFYLCLF
jgi:hypothetical protein